MLQHLPLRQCSPTLRPPLPAAMVQQADQGFGFSLVGGIGPTLYLYPAPEERSISLLEQLSAPAPLQRSTPLAPRELGELRASLIAWQVSRVICPVAVPHPSFLRGGDPTNYIKSMTRLFGPGRRHGSTLVWAVR